MPLQATSGAASYDAFGGGVAAVPNYIEDVFSTYLYTGNGSTQTITNGIDLAGEGGLVWWKNRTNATGHGLIDTTRGIDYYLSSNTTDAQDGPVSYISSVSSTGYSIGAGTQFVNQSANNYASWTFRKQPKFFDVVTYSGNSTAGRTVAHNLGSVPGCMIVKDLLGGPWYVYHQSLGNTQTLVLNSSTNAGTDPSWNNTTPTSTVFTLGDNYQVNYTGHDYVAYLFAHNAGGFGLTGTDNVISCGSYSGGSGTTYVTLGYEPQFILKKNATSTGNWVICDNMRGMPTGGNSTANLLPNSSGAETTATDASGYLFPTATGFGDANANSGQTYIYIAIRRGPMKVPTSGTSVFSPIYSNPSTTNTPQTTGFPVDMQINRYTGAADDNYVVDRLRGVNTTATNNATPYLLTNSTASEGSSISTSRQWTNTTFGSLSAIHIYWNFGRAPSFFDEVCYTGTGVARTLNHNLGAVPELMIVKRRDGTSYGDWLVYHASLGNTKYLLLNTSDASATANSGAWNFTNPTSTQFTVGDWESLNTTATYVAYLFATCAGVSKVFSYTGNGSSQTINCGFTAGARWILIKRTDSTGDWYVWDSARGIVSGNDPHLSLNTTAAEVTTDDTIDTDSTGFVVNQVSATNVNVSSATYIGIAIA